MAWLVAACVRGGSVAASDCAGRCHGKRAACVRCDTDVLGRAGDGYVACTHARCPFGIGMGRSCRCRVVCSMSACRMACRGRYGSVMPYGIASLACVFLVLLLLALPHDCVMLPIRACHSCQWICALYACLSACVIVWLWLSYQRVSVRGLSSLPAFAIAQR